MRCNPVKSSLLTDHLVFSPTYCGKVLLGEVAEGLR